MATPGRLWELLSGGHTDYLADLSGLRYLVLDEADRMIETGHFAELNLIVDAVLRGTTSFSANTKSRNFTDRLKGSSPSLARIQAAAVAQTPTSSTNPADVPEEAAADGKKPAGKKQDTKDKKDKKKDNAGTGPVAGWRARVNTQTPKLTSSDLASSSKYDSALPLLDRNTQRQTFVFSATLSMDQYVPNPKV